MSLGHRMELCDGLQYIKIAEDKMASQKGISPFYYDSRAGGAAPRVPLLPPAASNAQLPNGQAPPSLRAPTREQSSSDTDSGFYGDSGSEQSQLSPSQHRLAAAPPLPPKPQGPGHPHGHPSTQGPVSRSRSAHLARVAENGEWSLGTSSGTSSTNSSLRSATGPQKPSLRVRFADQADLPPPPPPTRPHQDFPQPQQHFFPSQPYGRGHEEPAQHPPQRSLAPSSSAHSSLGRSGRSPARQALGSFSAGQSSVVDRPCFYYQTGGATGVASPPQHRRSLRQGSSVGPPPPYYAAVDRLKELRGRQDSVRLPLQPPPKPKKTGFLSLKSRSASLSRIAQDSRKPSWTVGRSLEESYASLVRQKAASLVAPNARSMEHLDQVASSALPLDTDTIRRGRTLDRGSGPVAKLIGRKESRGRREERGPATLTRSLSTSFPSHATPRAYSDQEMESREISVRVLGMDSSGAKVLVLDKLRPGPFGFYISTGVAKRRRGIFVSRVSAWTLRAHLSVGDELLEIDGVRLAGRGLEEAQALIRNKMAITIAVQPNVIPT